MPRRTRVGKATEIVGRLEKALGELPPQLKSSSLREAVLHLVAIKRDMSDLGVSVAHSKGANGEDAKERMKLYLIAHEGVVINSEELQIVAGIAEFGRRIRELRVQEGYQVLTGASSDEVSGAELRPDEYLLVDRTPDIGLAERWRSANTIRRSKQSSKKRVFQFLAQHVGQVVTTEELAYVARGKKEFARRARELRTEDGYAVSTRFTGRPDLRSGQYVLESLERISKPHDRNIRLEVQKEVYQRDGNRCVCCGWTHERWTKSDPRILELHHVEEHELKGSNETDNLHVLCSLCHDNVHASRIDVVKTADDVRFIPRASRQ